MEKEKKYNIHFRVVKDIKDKKFKDCLPLEMEINDDLLEVLKSVCVNLNTPNEYVDTDYYIGRDDKGTDTYFKFKRPLIKAFILGGLYDYKHLLFNIELLKNKKVMIPVSSIEIMENIIYYSKDNVKKLLENIIKTEVNVNFDYIGKVNREENEE